MDPTTLVGQYVKYKIDPGQSAASKPGELVVKTGQTTVVNLAVGPDPKKPAGTAWQFTFLKYCAGEVTVCALAGGVLTGPMSGCYLFRYTGASGKPSVAHVGTDNTPDDPGTIRAKEIWNTVVAAKGHNAVGDAPTKTISKDDIFKIAKENNNNMPILCGYFEGQNAWAVLFVPALDGKTLIPGVLKIALVRKMPLLQWSAVAGMREWR
jgi:hypothetical protein